MGRSLQLGRARRCAGAAHPRRSRRNRVPRVPVVLCAETTEDNLAQALVAVLAGEGLALVAWRGCPFGVFRRRAGDDVPMFELWFGRRLAALRGPDLQRGGCGRRSSRPCPSSRSHHPYVVKRNARKEWIMAKTYRLTPAQHAANAVFRAMTRLGIGAEYRQVLSARPEDGTAPLDPG